MDYNIKTAAKIGGIDDENQWFYAYKGKKFRGKNDMVDKSGPFQLPLYSPHEWRIAPPQRQFWLLSLLIVAVGGWASKGSLVICRS